MIYLLWFLVIGTTAKHLPTLGETSEENQRYSSLLSPLPKLSSLESTLSAETSTANETSTFIETEDDIKLDYTPTIHDSQSNSATFDGATDGPEIDENKSNKDSGTSSPLLETNSIQKIISTFENEEYRNDNRSLKKVFLSNKSIVCNDGTQSGFYLRKSLTGSPVWIVFLEGGWYCFDKQSCRNRWLRLRHLMTSSQWPDSRDVGGILSPNPTENPFWHSANHVVVPYCSSDTWSGTTSPLTIGKDSFHFMGKLIVLQVIKDLIALGLENSTQLIFAGSSAGGTGVIINLDPVQHLLHNELGLKHITVRGISDSGWFLDRTPFSKSTFSTSILPPVDAIKKGYSLWQGSLPKRCVDLYRDEPWRCYFGYRTYPTLRAPLFVFQWLFDEAQMTADNVGAPVTPQQWDYIHRMGNALRASFRDVNAVFAPSCVSHSVLTKRDWLHVSVDDVTIAQALRCWELATTKKQPKNHLTISNSSSGKTARKLVKSGGNQSFSKISGTNVNKHKSNVNRQIESNKQMRNQNRRRRRKKIDDKNNKDNGAAIKRERNKVKNKNESNNQDIWMNNRNNSRLQQLRISSQRRKNNIDNNGNRRPNPKNNNKQNRRRGNIQNCLDENNFRHNQRFQPNRRWQQRCNNHNGQHFRRHVRNKNKLSIQHLPQTENRNNDTFGILVNAVIVETKNADEEKNEPNKHQLMERQMRQQRSLIRGFKTTGSGCEHRHIERCSWPQCNHSCPRLVDPYTGEEVHFMDMLKSFGLEMESVAQALGVDMQTLNNMEHAELLNLLTQQSN